MNPASHEKLSFREMIAFGCGDFASCLYWQAFMRFLPFFYTDVFGISAGALATMLLLSRVWDGVNDPIIGIWADRTETRWGKFRPFILYGCVPFAIFGVLTFTTPNFGPTGKLIWAYVTYNGLMMLYTIVNIPYTALLGVMTSDPVERTRLSSVKFVFAFGGGLVISWLLLRLVEATGGSADSTVGWQWAWAIVGIFAAIFFLVTVVGTKERIKPVPENRPSIKRDLRFLVTNRPWLLLLGTTLAWILFIAVRSSVSAHYFKYYVYGGNPDAPLSFLGQSYTFAQLLSDFNTWGQGASVLGVACTGFVAARFSKRVLFIALFLFQIAAYLAFYFLQPSQVGAIFVLEIVGSFFGAPLPVLMWAMYADTADYGEWKTGRRTTALVFSASTMSQKIGWALAAFLAFQMLQLVGFAANEIPSDTVKASLVGLMSFYPACLGVVAVIVFLFYPLNERRMIEINEDLARRRASIG